MWKQNGKPCQSTISHVHPHAWSVGLFATPPRNRNEHAHLMHIVSEYASIQRLVLWLIQTTRAACKRNCACTRRASGWHCMQEVSVWSCVVAGSAWVALPVKVPQGRGARCQRLRRARLRQTLPVRRQHRRKHDWTPYTSNLYRHHPASWRSHWGGGGSWVEVWSG